MLRVSKVADRPGRPPATAGHESHSPGGGDCVIIRPGPGDGGADGGMVRRPAGCHGVSGASAGARALGLQLVMLPPASRGTPHFHTACETAIYLVSGEAEIWHGAGLVRRCTVRAGDFVYIPPGTPHLAVNHGEVTSIAVVARTDPADAEGTVMIELPGHLAGLRDLPVTATE